MATWDARGPQHRGTEGAPRELHAQVSRADGPEEAPYHGRVGQTRVEHLHVPLADGTLRRVSVYRAVNVGSDPHLREPALGGLLHRMETGEELAMSFVFHDPAARKLCVVVPEVLRHQELREKARLLTEIAEDTEHPVPRYAREAHSVVGLAALAAWLARPSTSLALSELERREAASDYREAGLGERERAAMSREQGVVQREQALVQREQGVVQREQALAQREQAVVQHEQVAAQQIEQRLRDLATREEQLGVRESRIRDRAENVTRREDELATIAEEQEAQQRDLAMREQELEQRLEALVQREQSVSQRDHAHREAEARPKSAPPPRQPPSVVPPPSARPIAEPDLEPEAEPEDADDVEELDELEPIATNPGATHSLAAAAVDGERVSDAPTDAVDEIVDDDDVEEELDDDDVIETRDVTGVHSNPTPEEGAEEPRTTLENAGEATADAPSLPEGVPAEIVVRELVLQVQDGVEAFARAAGPEAFGGTLDLRAQLAVIDGYPVVLVALVSEGDGAVARAALDPRGAEDRRVLDALRRRFEAYVTVLGPDLATLRTTKVAAPREANVARILDRCSRLRGEEHVSAEVALARAMAAPPALDEHHPFGEEPAETAPRSAAQVLASLEELSEWTSPERTDHAMLQLSVTRDAIDAALHRGLVRALSSGLALRAELRERAVEAGLARDAGALVTKQIEAFRATTSAPDKGGLDREQIATNWERLLSAAADVEVAIDVATHDEAWRAIRDVRGESTGSRAPELDEERLAEMGAPELVMMLEHPRHRQKAALALADRGDPALAEALCKAVRKMPRPEVVRVVPRIIKLGEEAGDALVDGLSARKTFARQAFALALGHLKLRRAVVPLLHVLSSEPSDVWLEVARVVGSFGNAAFRTLSRQLADPKTSEERWVRTLAHLALHGCDKAIADLTKDADARVARIAVKALAARDEARGIEEVVAGKRPLEGASPVIAFSRRFMQELEGSAPDGDLSGDDES